MIRERIEKLLNLSDTFKLMLFDQFSFSNVFSYSSILSEYGFKIIYYVNVEAFRVKYEEEIKLSEERIAVVVNSDIYVPYDIQQKFRKVNLSLAVLFPMLHAKTLTKYILDIDLISFAYDSCYADASTAEATEKFITNAVYAKSTIEMYCSEKTKHLLSLCKRAARYTDWIAIAKLKAVIHYYGAKASIETDSSFVDEVFAGFINMSYASLSSELSSVSPAIITKTLGMICGTNTDKTTLIVIDGMSLFDFEAISRSFVGIDFEFSGSFALIPTTTPISRQSLLSGKYPRELEKPFSLVNEEKEFKTAGQKLGYASNQIQYVRGYKPNISQFAKLVAVIINDVDEIVHGQRQGRLGMYNDMHLLGKNGELQGLIKLFIESGFDVYITADHGNTPCVGVGNFHSGIELQTRSMRMAVLKDFADKHCLLDEYTDEYAGHYLDKSFRYFVCKPGVTFGSKNEQVMAHGGMTIDEVIVPFIHIKGAK